MKKVRYCFFLLWATFAMAPSTGLAEAGRVDSLKAKILTLPDDTNKVKVLNDLFWATLYGTDQAAPLQYADQQRKLSEKIGDKRGLTQAYNEIGCFYFMRADYQKALKNLNLSLYLSKEIGFQRGIRAAYTNLSNVYRDQGNFPEALLCIENGLEMARKDGNKKAIADALTTSGNLQKELNNYPEALKNHLSALSYRMELKDQKGIADCYNNIGNIYSNLKKYDEALKNHLLSLKISRDNKNLTGVTSSLINLSEIYTRQLRYQDAINSLTEVLEIQKKLGNKRSIADAYNNLAENYERLQDYKTAIRYQELSKSIRTEIGDEEGLCECLANSANLYILLHQFDKAKAQLELAEQAALHLQSKLRLVEIYTNFKRLDSATGDFKEVLRYAKLCTLYNDSIFNDENTKKTTRAEMTFEFDKKEALMKAEQEKTAAIASAERRKQNIIIFAVSGALLLILSFALVAFRNYRLKQKANITLEFQKKSIEDSIRYAQRIQEAILPPALFETGEVHDHFLIFKPKDVVSGDFYWRYREGDYLFTATVDCTGHGVPGAMMSMLGYDLLENAVKDKGLREPASILNLMNRQVIEKLDSYNSESATESMDLTLCRLNLMTRELVYAGAKNDLFLLSENELWVLPVTKCSIGYAREMEYTQESRILKPKDELYLMTDGFADQKGGPEGNKFMIKKVKSLFQTLSALSCPEQKHRLLNELEQWRGVMPQKDDILLVGFII